MVKRHIGCGGNADGITHLADGNVITWIEVNRFTCSDLLACRTIVARQRPAFLQLGDVGAVLVNGCGVLRQSIAVLVNGCSVLRQSIGMLYQGIAVLAQHIAQIGHDRVGGIQL